VARGRACCGIVQGLHVLCCDTFGSSLEAICPTAGFRSNLFKTERYTVILPKAFGLLSCRYGLSPGASCLRLPCERCQVAPAASLPPASVLPDAVTVCRLPYPTPGSSEARRANQNMAASGVAIALDWVLAWLVPLWDAFW
jgi:hypothetical protein